MEKLSHSLQIDSKALFMDKYIDPVKKYKEVVKRIRNISLKAI